MRPIEPPENTSSMPAMPPALLLEDLGQGVRDRRPGTGI